MMVDIENLPEPSGAFAWAQAGPGVGLVCHALEPYARHVFTSRAWMLGSAGTPAGWQEGWSQVASAMGVDPAHLVRLNQVHGAAHLVAARGPAPGGELPDADIVLTDREDLALGVQAADCVPLLIADTAGSAGRSERTSGAVAAAHAGWRGLAARVPERTVAALGREHGSRPQDLVAVLGPSIGSCCYQVGPDVRRRFADAGFAAEEVARWFSPAPVPSARNPPMPGLDSLRRDDRWYFDGWLAARQQLTAAGVPDASIYCSELCTASHPAWLCSYRRDGTRAGRLAGAIRSRSRP
jgi:hypothetical protein